MTGSHRARELAVVAVEAVLDPAAGRPARDHEHAVIGDLARLSDAHSRSITAENPTGAPGAGGLATDGFGAHAARDLGPGWKISPAVRLPAGALFPLADIAGPGAVRHLWLTSTVDTRLLVLRFYWDDQEQPSVECPLGDFFASGWGRFAQISSLAVCVNPTNGFNCYWPMPFRRRCRITVQNLSDDEASLFYQVDYELGAVPDDEGYFHAQFRRINPLPYGQVYPILDGATGRGQYVGTALAWAANEPGWWGEGEVKFYLDGEDAPTICGTGTEDYFGGAWCFLNEHGYQTFTGPYTGMPLASQPADGVPGRFSLYRWHLADPIRFTRRLQVTVQALGWRDDERYVPLRDDIASVAYWYQTLPTAPFPPLPGRDALRVS
jgi:Protein of unknown function (DUF2961)